MPLSGFDLSTVEPIDRSKPEMSLSSELWIGPEVISRRRCPG
ncbi:hypothetical protein RHOER0001_5199 [Rhodococcus erythropolis SK121]|nr:hypothetical protein RHOER0001_5199 [Rhodococcus erythropolis SK121]